MEVGGEEGQNGEVDSCCDWGGDHCSGEDEGEEQFAVGVDCCVYDLGGFSGAVQAERVKGCWDGRRVRWVSVAHLVGMSRGYLLLCFAISRGCK